MALPAGAEQRPMPRPDMPVVVIDPGHGGRDPGADAGDLTEADLMLAFATELARAIETATPFDARLTRATDTYVSLDDRIARARALGADAFLSLHADTLPGGASARGATVYTLADSAGDAASRRLVERHEAGLLSRSALTPADGDGIALVLLDMARRETRPRTEALAGQILSAFDIAGLPVAPRPRRTANFSVLKSADMPSVLLELGFLSSDADLARLATPEGRAPVAAALAGALDAWWADDRARDALKGR